MIGEWENVGGKNWHWFPGCGFVGEKKNKYYNFIVGGFYGIKKGVTSSNWNLKSLWQEGWEK